MSEINLKEAFKSLKEKAPESYTLRGSSILVEILRDEEIKTESGIVIAQDSKQVRGSIDEHRLKVGRVLLVGEGYYDESGDTVPLDTAEDDIVILPKYSLSEISVWPGLHGTVNGRLAVIKEDAILFKYNGEEGYNAAKEILNAQG